MERRSSQPTRFPVTPDCPDNVAAFRRGCIPSLPLSLSPLLQERRGFFDAVAQCYRCLFDDEIVLNREHTFSRYDRLSVALTVAQVTQLQSLSSFYAAQLAPLDYPHNTREGNNRLTQLTQHARLLAWNPALLGEQDIRALRQAGLTPSDIVTLSQIVGFVSLQARLIAATAALAGESPPLPQNELPLTAIAAPAQEHPAPWRPYLPLAATVDYQPLPVCGAPPGMAFAMMLLNMHRAGAAQESRRVFNEGFNCNERLRQPLRELAFLISARINHCARSGRHHLTRYLLLSKHRNQAEALYDNPLNAMAQCGRRDRAVIHASLTLAQTPARFTPDTIGALAQAELSDAQALELIIATSTAAWAQRLLVSLGE